MPRFILITEESGGDCEWDTFIDGRECWNPPRFVVIDTQDHCEPETPEGFHRAHGCYDHAAFMLEITEGN
jgi:hypothetical protein